MSDPRRYYIDPMVDRSTGDPFASLHIEAAESGDWIKYADFEDYKAAQRRNATLEANTRLGVEIAQLRAEKEAETKATFDAIRLITQLRDENERLRKAGDALDFIIGNFYFEEGGEIDKAKQAWMDAAKGVQS